MIMKMMIRLQHTRIVVIFLSLLYSFSCSELILEKTVLEGNVPCAADAGSDEVTVPPGSAISFCYSLSHSGSGSTDCLGELVVTDPSVDSTFEEMIVDPVCVGDDPIVIRLTSTASNNEGEYTSEAIAEGRPVTSDGAWITGGQTVEAQDSVTVQVQEEESTPAVTESPTGTPSAAPTPSPTTSSPTSAPSPAVTASATTLVPTGAPTAATTTLEPTGEPTASATTLEPTTGPSTLVCPADPPLGQTADTVCPDNVSSEDTVELMSIRGVGDYDPSLKELLESSDILYDIQLQSDQVSFRVQSPLAQPGRPNDVYILHNRPSAGFWQVICEADPLVECPFEGDQGNQEGEPIVAHCDPSLVSDVPAHTVVSVYFVSPDLSDQFGPVTAGNGEDAVELNSCCHADPDGPLASAPVLIEVTYTIRCDCPGAQEERRNLRHN